MAGSPRELTISISIKTPPRILHPVCQAGQLSASQMLSLISLFAVVDEYTFSLCPPQTIASSLRLSEWKNPIWQHVFGSQRVHNWLCRSSRWFDELLSVILRYKSVRWCPFLWSLAEPVGRLCIHLAYNSKRIMVSLYIHFVYESECPLYKKWRPA